MLDALDRGGYGPGRANGKETTFRCPVHERDGNHKPSLDVSEGRDGKALLQCRSRKCNHDEILKALKIGPSTNGTHRGNGKPPWKIVATYDYRDEHGNVLYQAVRYEPKDFRQRTPDGNGGWIWTVTGIRKVPYRLPELLAAPKSEPVFIVEGEKDCDALSALGLIATTNVGGSEKFIHIDPTTRAEAFRDRPVINLPDNDESGRKHARQVIECLAGIAAGIWICALPGLPEKGDVSDWLAAGGTRDQLLRLADGAPTARKWMDENPPLMSEEETGKAGESNANSAAGSRLDESNPETSGEYRFKFNPITSKELSEGDFRIDWLVSWKLAAMQPAVIAAFAKGMKTSIAIDLVVSLGSGTPFLGKFEASQRVRVALLSGESGRYTIQETARRICRARGIELADVDALWDFDLPQLADLMDLAELTRGLKAAAVDVVIIDPLYLCLLSGAAIGPDASKNVYAIGPLLLAISRRCIEIGVTPILIHHSNRSIEVGKPMELQHLSGAGVAEFARQWILLNRDTPYKGDGSHRVWMNIGGSAGQGGLYMVAIEEGNAQDEGGRKWDVEVLGAADAVKEKQGVKKSKSEADKEAKFKSDLDRCFEMVCLFCEAKPHIAIKRQIRSEGHWSDDRAELLLQKLLNDKRIEAKEIKPKKGRGGNKRVIKGYVPVKKEAAE